MPFHVISYDARLFIFNDVCPNVRVRYVCGRRVVTFAVVANVHVDIVVTDAAVH
jgi:hypothetical protein